MTLSPIALFTYNRPEHTKRTVEALQQNKLAAASDLFIFSDGLKKGFPDNRVAEVRKYLKEINGFKSVRIIERESNIGLSHNIIKGVQQTISNFGKVIVLEDDMLTSPYFLDYMNEGLETYEADDRVISIHGYVYPVHSKLPETFFLKGADCWGWATWKRGWDLFEPDGRILLDKIEKTSQVSAFDFDNSYPFTQMLRDQINGKTNSWAVRWYASAFLKNKFTLYPGKSLVTNIGGDGSGTNVGFNHLLYNPYSSDPIKVSRQEVVQDQQAFQAFAAYHRKITRPSFWYKIKRRLKPIFK
jgi:Glycosyl transferase family 2